MNKLVCILFVALVIECLSVSAAPQSANEAPQQKSAENEDDIIRERLSQPKSSENDDTVQARLGSADPAGHEENGDDNTGIDELTLIGANNGQMLDPSNPVASAQSMMTNMRTVLQAIRRFDQLLEVFSKITGISSS